MKKITFLLLGVVAFTSCDIHDPVDDVLHVGKEAPTVYWGKLPASVKPGENISFELQYYAAKGVDINELAVWYNIYERTAYSVSCPIVTSFKYTVQNDSTRTVREFIPLVNYTHKAELWNDSTNSYLLNGAFPTTYTLTPTEWKDIDTFDEEKFKEYFSGKFGDDFRDSIYVRLQVADYQNLFTKVDTLIKEADFHLYVDTIDNPSSGKKDLIIDPNFVEDFKTKFYENFPIDKLLFDDASGLYKIEYSKEYSVGARFKVTDSQRMSNYSEEKKVQLQ